jgi:hypothetical protein
MNRVNRKDFYPVKRNSVLLLASGDDNFKTSSFFLKYLIAPIKMIGSSLTYSSLVNQNLNFILIVSFK